MKKEDASLFIFLLVPIYTQNWIGVMATVGVWLFVLTSRLVFNGLNSFVTTLGEDSAHKVSRRKKSYRKRSKGKKRKK